MSDYWARRKAAVAAEARAEAEAELAVEIAAQEAALEEIPDAQLLADAGLPEPEELDSAEAVQEFLKAELPRRLKTRALRRLWRLNPVLANLDGLIDYGEDYTDSATVIENMQTVYQVGKGMFDKFAEEPAPEDTAADASEDLLAEDDAPDVDEGDMIAMADLPEPVPYTFTDEDEPQPAPAPRRMRFQFDTAEGQT